MSSQWSQGTLPAPEGIVPNFVNPHNQLNANIAVHSTFLTISTLAVIMRIYTRIRINRDRLGVDDYLAVFSWLANIAWTGIMLEAMRWGIGRHMWDEPAPWLVSALQYETIGSWIYIATATSMKLSFLFLYRRLFTGNMRMKSNWLINIGIALCFLFNLGMLFGVIFFCIPVAKGWNDSLPGHCSDPDVLSYLTGAWNIAVDFYILIIPIPIIRRLNMAKNQRARLTAVFSIGAFACVASIVRLGMTAVLQSNTDSTYNLARVGLWATIEINVGLTCSCLMLLPAFLRHHLTESAKCQLRSMRLSRPKIRMSSNSTSYLHASPEHEAKSSQHQPDFVTGRLVSSEDSTKHILKTETFTMQSLPSSDPALTDLETGEVTTGGNNQVQIISGSL